MIKKLDILILKAFVGPFIATFFITLFVFMMQILWKYIDDLVGKGLDFLTLAEFLVYASATLVTLALPISILLSSIMTFGKLGENFELVAIKSSGISLLRFMRPLLIVTIFLTGVAFLFANNIAPVANLKFARIYYDIYQKSPAFDLRPGVFYNGFQGYSIKVAAKQQDSLLNDVIIFEQSSSPEDNTILAKKGKMIMSTDKSFLEFHLDNGYRYSEEYNYDPQKTEYVNLGFRSYTKLFDMSQLNLRKTPDSLFMNNIRMKSIRQLNEDLDSLRKLPAKSDTSLRRDMAYYVLITKYHDTPFKKPVDTAFRVAAAGDSFESLIPDSLRRATREFALNRVSSAKNVVSVTAGRQKGLRSEITLYDIEWHKKLSMSVACLVLFFIGAPLGSIIRKGGLGLPLVMALIFFMVYYLLNIFGEKFAKDQLVSPVIGLWLPVIVLTPVGFFLTYKAMHDSQLFNKEFYFRLGKKIKKLMGLKQVKEEELTQVI